MNERIYASNNEFFLFFSHIHSNAISFDDPSQHKWKTFYFHCFSGKFCLTMQFIWEFLATIHQDCYLVVHGGLFCNIFTYWVFYVEEVLSSSYFCALPAPKSQFLGQHFLCPIFSCNQHTRWHSTFSADITGRCKVLISKWLLLQILVCLSF